MMSHRWDIFFLFPKAHRMFLWYMSRKFPVVDGGREGGGWGGGVKTEIDGDSNHSPHQPLSFTIITCPRPAFPNQWRCL